MQAFWPSLLLSIISYNWIWLCSFREKRYRVYHSDVFWDLKGNEYEDSDLTKMTAAVKGVTVLTVPAQVTAIRGEDTGDQGFRLLWADDIVAFRFTCIS